MQETYYKRTMLRKGKINLRKAKILCMNAIDLSTARPKMASNSSDGLYLSLSRIKSKKSWIHISHLLIFKKDWDCLLQWWRWKPHLLKTAIVSIALVRCMLGHTIFYFMSYKIIFLIAYGRSKKGKRCKLFHLTLSFNRCYMYVQSIVRLKWG